jgi:hypothetical protein
MQTHQETIAGVGLPNPVFSVEVKQHIFQRLSDLASINGIPIKVLVSRLLMHMVVYHRMEIKEIVERIKCPAAW